MSSLFIQQGPEDVDQRTSNSDEQMSENIWNVERLPGRQSNWEGKGVLGLGYGGSTEEQKAQRREGCRRGSWAPYQR